MLIKSADDKSERLKLLEELQQSSVLARWQKDRLRNELKNLKTGLKGEADAAFFINAHYADAPDFAVLHDLRIVVDGEVAQIDHLLLSRVSAYLLETKNFGGNITVNEYGEFSVSYADGREFGIPSPLEQSKRHGKVLLKLLRRLNIPSADSRPLEIRHVVLVHPKSFIHRPDSRLFDTSNIIKADSLRTWHDRFQEREIGVFKAAFKYLPQLILRSSDDVHKWGKLLARQHRPQRLQDYLPDYIPQPSELRDGCVTAQIAPITGEPVCATCGDVLSEKVAFYCHEYADRFAGQLYCMQHQKDFPKFAFVKTGTITPSNKSSTASTQLAQLTKNVCDICGCTLSPQVSNYCQRNAKRFGGKLYCREHQKGY